MTLPTSGPMLASMINAEIGRAGNAYFDINGAAERQLAGVPTGQVSFWDFYGKSRGFLTPQADYVDPNTLDDTQTWSVSNTFCEVTLSFKNDGTISTTGTLGDAMPAEWYQNDTIPSIYSIMYQFVSSTFTGDTDVSGTIQNTGIWFPITPGVNAPALYVNLSKETVPSAATALEVVFNILLSDGLETVISFQLTATVNLNP